METGQTLTLDFEADEMVSVVKTKIQEKKGIKVEDQILVFNETLLKDWYSLERYNVKTDSMLYLYKENKVKIISPTSKTYNSNKIDLNVTANFEVDKWWYKLNNGDKVFFEPNLTLSLENDNYNLYIYANDSDGNIYSDFLDNGFKMLVNFSGVWSEPYISFDSNGNYYVCFKDENKNGHLYRFDSLSNKIWNLNINLSGSQYRIQADLNDDLILFRQKKMPEYKNIGYLEKYDKNSSLIWSQLINESSSNPKLFINSNNEIILIYAEELKSQNNFIWRKYTSSGNFISKKNLTLDMGNTGKSILYNDELFLTTEIGHKNIAFQRINNNGIIINEMNITARDENFLLLPEKEKNIYYYISKENNLTILKYDLEFNIIGNKTFSFPFEIRNYIYSSFLNSKKELYVPIGSENHLKPKTLLLKVNKDLDLIYLKNLTYNENTVNQFGLKGIDDNDYLEFSFKYLDNYIIWKTNDEQDITYELSKEPNLGESTEYFHNNEYYISTNTYGGSIHKHVNYAFKIDFIDSDGDGLDDKDDKLNDKVDKEKVKGFDKIKIKVNNASSSGSFDDIRNITVDDEDKPVIQFKHNFTKSNLNFNNVSVKKDKNFLIVNLSNQLQINYNKTLWIDDNDFVKFCVIDKDIRDENDISDDCSGVNEYVFDSCLGNSTGVTISGITCIDHGSRLEVQNLRHSALFGTPNSDSSSSISTSGSSYKGKEYDINFFDNFNEVKLRTRDEIKFEFDDKEYILKIRKIYSNSIKIQFDGKKDYFKINLEDTLSFDLNNDGNKDLILEVIDLSSKYVYLNYNLIEKNLDKSEKEDKIFLPIENNSFTNNLNLINNNISSLKINTNHLINKINLNENLSLNNFNQSIVESNPNKFNINFKYFNAYEYFVIFFILFLFFILFSYYISERRQYFQRLKNNKKK